MLQLDDLRLCCLLGRDDNGTEHEESTVGLLELLDPGLGLLKTGLGLRSKRLAHDLFAGNNRLVRVLLVHAHGQLGHGQVGQVLRRLRNRGL